MGQFTDYETHVDHYERDFYARLTTVATGTGFLSGLNLYGFVEVFPFGNGGAPLDLPGGRTCDPTVTVNMFALEANNQLLTVPGSTPTGFTNAGPYIAHMRFHSMMNGNPVFIFDAPASSGGGSIALLDKSGGTVDASMAFFQMDTDGVITATNLSTGHDQIAVTDAGASQRGVINITTQTMAGQKTWNDRSTFVVGLLSKGSIQLQTGSSANSNLLIATDNSGSGHAVFTFTNSSGSTAGILQFFGGTAKTLSYNGNVSFVSDCFLGPGNLATTATTGFAYIPTCVGAPTGTPASAGTGWSPIQYDDTTNVLYIWNTGTGTWLPH